MATDPNTGKTEPHRVTHLIRTEDDKKFNKLSIATGQGIESLTATHEHPFWSPSEKDWIPARALHPGMTLRTDKGATVIVTANKPFTKPARTYNLTVEGLHTYYVLAGRTPVLVHNSNCPTSGDSGSPSSPKKKRVEHLQPDGDTEGSHTVFERDENGRIIRYQTWIEEPRSPSGWRLGPRFRGTGKPHSGVNPPLYYPKGGGYGESATGEHLPLGY